MAGLLTALLGFLGWLFAMGGTFFAVQRYRRQLPGSLTATEGAKLGVFTSLLTSAFYAVFFGLRVALFPGELRAALDQAGKMWADLNLDPESMKMTQALFAGTGGIVAFAVMTVFFTLLFLAILGAISGGLAARLSRDRPNS